MRPMLGKTKWWEKKAVENKAESKHYKTWCVIKKAKFAPNTLDIHIVYKAVSWDNVPEVVDRETGRFTKQFHIKDLTRAEAVAMAKMLNYVGEVIELDPF